jgi:hypothetical protein
LLPSRAAGIENLTPQNPWQRFFPAVYFLLVPPEKP